MKQRDPQLEDYLVRLEGYLPGWLARFFRMIRRPALIWVRMPLSILLIFGGILSFLPILGVWMLPLGFLLLAEDVPFLQRPLVKAFQWGEKHWPGQKHKRE